MGLAKCGEFVTLISGNIGGTKNTNGKSGLVLSNSGKPINRQTAGQMRIRAMMSKISKSWASLTEAQRLAWNSTEVAKTYINRVATSCKLSGINLYSKLNLNLLSANVTMISDPPLGGEIDCILSLDSLTCTTSTQAINLAFSDSPTPAVTIHIVEATPAYSAGKTFVKGMYRKIHQIDPATASTVALKTYWQAVFGTFAEGQKISVRVTPLDPTTGLKGVPLEITGIAVA